jgi:hypothetical protein
VRAAPLIAWLCVRLWQQRQPLLVPPSSSERANPKEPDLTYSDFVTKHLSIRLIYSCAVELLLQNKADSKFIELIETLIKIPSPSKGTVNGHDEKDIFQYCCLKLKKSNFNVVNLDNWAIWATRGDGSLPLLNAHLDTKQQMSDIENNIAFYRDNETSLNEKEQYFTIPNTRIGGDDKAGIATILFLAKYTSLQFNILLTICEEIIYAKFDNGVSKRVKGIEHVPDNLYTGICWTISLDRLFEPGEPLHIIKSYEHCNGNMSSKIFLNELQSIASSVGVNMRLIDGERRADAAFIKNASPEKNVVNISAGFYGPNGDHGINDRIYPDIAWNVLRVVNKCISEKNRLIVPAND